jgi:hypothetical protein
MAEITVLSRSLRSMPAHVWLCKASDLSYQNNRLWFFLNIQPNRVEVFIYYLSPLFSYTEFKTSGNLPPP